MTETLKENYEFRRAYTRGKCYSSPALVTYVFMHRKSHGASRIGITTGKKLGNAVARSRARRVIRAAWRELFPQVADGADIVFVARMRTPASKSTDIMRTMRSHLISAGLIKGDGEQ